MDKFGEELKVAINKGSSKSIYAAIRKLVKSLNTLNDRFNSFIDTTEREELCNYINKCVLATGFKIEGNFDITEEWRKW